MMEPRKHQRAARISSSRLPLDPAPKAATQGDVRPRRPRLPLQLPDPISNVDQDAAVRSSANPQSTAQVVSDGQIAVLVHERLTELGTLITGRMLVRVHGNTIVLHGTIQSAHERRVVIACVRDVRPGMAIRDRLEILPARGKCTERPTDSPFQRRILKSIAVGSAALALSAILAVLCRDRTLERALVEMPVTVQASGSPAAGAFLTLHPLHVGAGRTAGVQNVRPQGRVANDGTVAWTTFQPGDGLPSGDYIVTATWSRLIDVYGEKQPGPNLLSQLYATVDTSPLRLEVPESLPVAAQPVVLRMQ